jgi:threonine/homoserine/homoserine lactone efflux protein
MSVELLLALSAFAFVSSITPGPNNLMLMASGVNFGFRRTLPHMLGVGLGFMLMVALVGVGLAGVFAAWPPAQRILQVVSVAYLLWLAWKIAQAAPPEAGGRRGAAADLPAGGGVPVGQPEGLDDGAGAIALYAPGQEVVAVLWVVAVFGLVSVPCVTGWTMLGTGARHLIAQPARLRLFNRAMALLLVASLWPVLVPPAGPGAVRDRRAGGDALRARYFSRRRSAGFELQPRLEGVGDVRLQRLRRRLAVAAGDRLDNGAMLVQRRRAAPLGRQRGRGQQRHRAVHQVQLLDQEAVVRGEVDLLVEPPVRAASALGLAMRARSSATMSRSTRTSSTVAWRAASRAASPSSSARTT